MYGYEIISFRLSSEHRLYRLTIICEKNVKKNTYIKKDSGRFQSRDGSSETTLGGGGQNTIYRMSENE